MSSFVNAFIGDTRNWPLSLQSLVVALITNSVFSVITTKQRLYSNPTFQSSRENHNESH